MKLKEYFIIADKDQMDTFEEKSIESITDFICDYYETLGVNYDGEYRMICKAALAAPMFLTKIENPRLTYDMIFITSEKFTYWCQVIYQLSHELTHCLIYANSRLNEKKASWIEESICEVMAYYFLKYFADNWEKCPLGKINPHYKKSVREYLANALNSEANRRLTKCRGYDALMEIDESSQTYRVDRRYEVIHIYENLKDKDILALIKYKEYILSNKRVLDTSKYCEEYKNNLAVQYLCELQKQILS